jgi:hypothetical protein
MPAHTRRLLQASRHPHPRRTLSPADTFAHCWRRCRCRSWSRRLTCRLVPR